MNITIRKSYEVTDRMLKKHEEGEEIETIVAHTLINYVDFFSERPVPSFSEWKYHSDGEYPFYETSSTIKIVNDKFIKRKRLWIEKIEGQFKITAFSLEIFSQEEPQIRSVLTYINNPYKPPEKKFTKTK